MLQIVFILQDQLSGPKMLCKYLDINDGYFDWTNLTDQSKHCHIGKRNRNSTVFFTAYYRK